jgi:hypothetical protein
MKSDELEKELKTALQEVGDIAPYWSEEDGMYVFEHPAYPMVMHADPDPEETRKGYLRALSGFVEERLQGTVAEDVERITSGRGGSRPGAGRPVGTKKAAKVRMMVPVDIAAWLQEPQHVDQVRRLMEG